MGNELEVIDEGTGEVISGSIVEVGGLSPVARAEIDMQVATARRYPRSPARIQKSLVEMVTLDEEAAEECVYALPRGDKPITGPSIRFAEALKQAWGNCRAASRITEVNRDEKYVEAEGVFLDLETNTATRFTHRRRISGKSGRVFSDDMILVTGNAACSVAMRESILKGIPKPVWRKAYDAVQKVVAGDVITLAENRQKAITAFAHYGVKPEQVFAVLGINGEDDIKLDHIVTMRGMFAAIKNGEQTVEDIFAKQEKQVDENYNPLLRGSATGSSSNQGDRHEVIEKNRSEPTQHESTVISQSETPAHAGTTASVNEGSGPETGKGGANPPTDIKKILTDYSTALLRATQNEKSLQTFDKQFWTKRSETEQSAAKTKAQVIYAIHVKRVEGAIDAETCKREVATIIG